MKEPTQVTAILRVPDPAARTNLFSTPPWWEQWDHPVERSAGATLLTVPGASWDGERTLLVAGSITTILATPTLDELTGWLAHLRTVLDARPAGSVHLAVSTPVESLDQLLTLATGRRWPAFDVAAAARRVREEPVPTPTVPGGLGAVTQIVDALAAAVEVRSVVGWASTADGVEAATASLIRSLDADPDVSDPDARALRDAARAGLADLEADGLRITGPRDALLWPVRAVNDLIPLDAAVDAALEVMLAQQETTIDLPTDRPQPRPLAERAGRELLDLLRRGVRR